MVDLRIIRVYNRYTTDELLSLVNVETDEGKAIDLATAIEQRAWEYMCCPCDDVSENTREWKQ